MMQYFLSFEWVPLSACMDLLNPLPCAGTLTVVHVF